MKIALLGCSFVVCAACSSSDGASAGAPTDGTGGLGGGGAAAGTGGVTASAPAVFSASVGQPSKDCRTEQVAKVCISIAGTWSGAPVDAACTSDTSPNYSFGNAWSMNCFTATHQISVNIPYAPGGGMSFGLASRTYDYKFLPHDAPLDASVQLSEGNPQAPSASDPSVYPGSSNFVSAEIGGTVSVDTATHLDALSGTFTTTWGTPTDPASREFSAALNGTFFAIEYMHPCKTNADCAADRRCASATCF